MKKDFVVESIKRIIAALLKKTGDRDRRDAIEWTTRLLKKCNTVSKEVEKVIFLCIDRGDHSLPRILALLSGNEKKKWGEKAITHFMKEGWLKPAKAVAETVGRRLSDNELTIIAKSIIANEVFSEDEEIAEVCKLVESNKKRDMILEDAVDALINEQDAIELVGLFSAGEKRNKMIEKVLQYLLKNRSWCVWEAISLNKLLSEQVARKSWFSIRRNAIDAGFLDAALHIAKCMKQELSSKELDNILSICKKEGYYKECISASKLLRREFSVNDKKELINHMLRKNELHEAKKAVSYLFPSNDDMEVKILFLTIISDRFIQKGHDTNLEDASKVVKSLPSKKAVVFKKKIVEEWLRILEKGEYVYMPNIEKAIDEL